MREREGEGGEACEVLARCAGWRGWWRSPRPVARCRREGCPRSEGAGEEILLMELVLLGGSAECRDPRGWIRAPPRGGARAFNRSLSQSRLVDASERWVRSS